MIGGAWMLAGIIYLAIKNKGVSKANAGYYFFIEAG
jgi:hypothetical protein